MMKNNKETEQDKYDKVYRKVEAMYRKGYNNETIIKQFQYLSKVEVLNMIQKIFALDMIKNERSRCIRV